MRVYEITATTNDAIADQYCRYLAEQHLTDMIATGCFTSASILRDGNRFRVSYYSPSQEMLDKYLSEFADKLRSHALPHFPAGVEITRDIWDLVSTVR